MESVFGKDPNEKKEPTVYERIGPEIAHLAKKTSVRGGPAGKHSQGAWTVVLILLAVVALYILDPFLYALHKTDAIRAYLYLHNYDSPNTTAALLATGIFTPDEVDTLDKEQGNYQGYFATPQAAQDKADAIVKYMGSLSALRKGRYDDLDYIGKIRYYLFYKTGVTPPISWSFLTPTVR